jgi:3-phenylpropionate/trans-cinnamate dioxygenase ferredoxin reductase subunit
MDDRIVIVGAGHAGGACAIALRENGFEGSITLVGEERHLPYERPSLSKTFLSSQAEPDFLADAARWAQLGVDVRLGAKAGEIDRSRKRLILSDGEAIGYDRLVIATGGHARALPIEDHGRVHYLRHIDDARRLTEATTPGSRAVVVGGGVIGLEVASTLRSQGLDVTVLEAGERLLGRNVPHDAAIWLAEAHSRVGVSIRLGRRLIDLSGEGPYALTLDDGAVIMADLVVAGIGIVPSVAFALSSGLAEDAGVPVDAGYRSLADPNVYAIGDVALRASPTGAARLETWAHALASAEAVARAITGLPTAAEPTPWFWTDQCGHTLQIAGQPEAADAVVSRGDAVRLYMKLDTLVGLACLDRPRDFAAGRRLIGTRLTPGAAADPGVDLRRAAA